MASPTENELDRPAAVSFGDDSGGAVTPSASPEAPAGTVESPPQSALTNSAALSLPVAQKSFSILIGVIVVAFIAVMLKRSSSSRQS